MAKIKYWAYWMLGEPEVPKEKKAELNQYIRKLFDRCGIRKMETLVIGDSEIPVNRKVRPDPYGICRFDSTRFVYLSRPREECLYDENTCRLELKAPGTGTFGMTMLLLMTLLESYADGSCCLMLEDRPYPYMRGLLEMLHQLLGREFYLNGRGRTWDMILFLRENESISFLREPMDLTELWASNFAYVDMQQWRESLYVYDFSTSREDDRGLITREEIKEADFSQRIALLRHTLEKLDKERADFLNADFLLCFLEKLLESDLQERRSMAEKHNDYGILAELSLYLLPPAIVKTLALVRGGEFWDMWDLLDIKGYKELLIKNEHKRKPAEMAKSDTFYQIIDKTCDDEFMEEWDGSNLKLSAEMEDTLNKWKKKIKTVTAVEEERAEAFFIDILRDLEEDWYFCGPAEKEFIETVLENKADERYRRFLSLLRDTMEEDIALFPELTKRQALDWVIRSNRSDFDYVKVKALQSLLINPTGRKIVFGF